MKDNLFSEKSTSFSMRNLYWFYEENNAGDGYSKTKPLPGKTAVFVRAWPKAARMYSLIRQTIFWYAVERLAPRGDRKSSKCGVASIHHFSPVFIGSDAEFCCFETPWFHWLYGNAFSQKGPYNRFLFLRRVHSCLKKFSPSNRRIAFFR